MCRVEQHAWYRASSSLPAKVAVVVAVAVAVAADRRLTSRARSRAVFAGFVTGTGQARYSSSAKINYGAVQVLYVSRAQPI